MHEEGAFLDEKLEAGNRRENNHVGHHEQEADVRLREGKGGRDL
jgi:hypothetical protein